MVESASSLSGGDVTGEEEDTPAVKDKSGKRDLKEINCGGDEVEDDEWG
jgi:hypothetical protein